MAENKKTTGTRKKGKNQIARITLVDDDRNTLTSVSMTFEAEGFQVDAYHDGQSALQAFGKSLPDMAVFDIKMPRMDGMDLLRQVRRSYSMPVIFLSARDDEIDEVVGLRLGADEDEYVTKPFSQRLLVERVRALLRRQKLSQSDGIDQLDASQVIVRGALRMDPLRHLVTWKD